MKRILVLLLTVMFTMSSLLVGCANGKSSVSQSGTDSGNVSSDTSSKGGSTVEDSSKSGSDQEYLEFSTLDSNIKEPIDSSKTEVGKIIKEKFNIVLKREPFTGSWAEKSALMLASGDYPDYLEIGDWDLQQKYLSAGVLVEIGSIAEKVAPNFLEFYKESIPFWKASFPDGKLYFWNPISQGADERLNPYFGNMSVRADVLKAMNYPNPLPLYSDEWIEFIKKAAATVPQTDGKKSIPCTTPLGSSWAWTPILAMMRSQVIPSLFPGVASLNLETGKFEDQYTDDLMDGYHFINTLYREGLLDPDALSDKGAQTTAKVEAGLPLTTYGFGVNNLLLEASGKGDRAYVLLPMIMSTDKGRPKTYYSPIGDTGPLSMFLTKKCKDPERFMKLMDYLCTEEGWTLNGWGIKDRQYTVDASGMKHMTKEFLDLVAKNDKAKLNAIGIDNFTWIANINMIDNRNNLLKYTASDEYRNLSITPAMKEALGKYGWEFPSDAFYKNPNMKMIPFDGKVWGIGSTVVIQPATDLGKSIQKVQDLFNSYVSKLFVAESEESLKALFDEVHKKAKDLGLDDIITELNKIYDEKEAKFN